MGYEANSPLERGIGKLRQIAAGEAAVFTGAEAMAVLQYCYDLVERNRTAEMDEQMAQFVAIQRMERWLAEHAGLGGMAHERWRGGQPGAAASSAEPE